MFVFIERGSILNSTISLMMTHDLKNKQREQTTTSRQQRQRGKENGGEVGRLLQGIGIGEGDLCLVNVVFLN